MLKAGTMASMSGRRVQPLLVALSMLCLAIVAEGEIRSSAKGTNLYDMVFHHVPLETVIDEFAKLPGVNIVVRPDILKGEVTAFLKGVEWKPALEAILRAFNLALVEERPDSRRGDPRSVQTQKGRRAAICTVELRNGPDL